jgi:hypothetical protein
MHKGELVAVIIAAIVGAVVKEIVALFFKRASNATKKAFGWLGSHPRYIGLFIQGSVLAFMLWVVQFAGDDKGIPTRGEVRAIIWMTIILFWQLHQFFFDLREVRALYKTNSPE